MKYVALKDVCKINMGQSPDSSSYNDKKEGIPFYQGNADFGEKHPIPRVWCNAPTKIAQPKDILMSVRAPIGALNYAQEKCCIGRGLAAITPDKDKLSLEFLYWFLRGKNSELNSKGTGSTFKAISKKTLEEIRVPLIDLEKQQKMAQALEKTYSVIQMRTKQLKELDDLIKARFVEMFGNPLDKSKANMYFVECVEFNPKKSEVKDLMCETVSFVPMECVGADGSFKIKEDGLVKDYYKGYTYFKNGDVLLAKITPCFENGKVAIAENCTNGIGFGTTEFHVSRPIPGVSNSQWIKYMLKNEHVHELATINMTGSAGQKRIQTPFFEKLKVYLPPIELQNQFADFVSQIDKSKATVQKALDETQLLFDSLMQQYFG